MHLPRKIREFYDSDGEVPIWNGEPNAMPVSRITHPIIMFVTFVGIVLLGMLLSNFKNVFGNR